LGLFPGGLITGGGSDGSGIISTSISKCKLQSAIAELFGEGIQRAHSRWLDRLLASAGASHQVTPARSIVVAAHPDDETMGCGGLICLKRRRGVQVEVVLLTDGGRGKSTSNQVSESLLTERRYREFNAAVEGLGVPTTGRHLLGYRDARLGELTPTERADAVQRIRGIVLASRATEVYVPHRHDIHPDHEAANVLTRAAVESVPWGIRVYEYSLWMLWLAKVGLSLRFSDLCRPSILQLGDALSIKRRAVRRYVSQLPGLPTGFVDRCLQPYEIYFEVGRAPGRPFVTG
jgi:N-acetylglucosamine malate deacetylase 1